MPPEYVLLALVFVVIAMVGVCTNWWTAAQAVKVLEEQMQVCGGCPRCVEAKRVWRAQRADRHRL